MTRTIRANKGPKYRVCAPSGGIVGLRFHSSIAICLDELIYPKSWQVYFKMDHVDGNFEQCAQVWDRLAGYPASGIDEALQDYLGQVARLVVADDVTWLGAVNGRTATREQVKALNGWDVRVIRGLDASADRLLRRRDMLKTHRTRPSMVTAAATEGSGQLRVLRLRGGLLDFERFAQTEHYRKNYKAYGIEDRIIAAIPVQESVEFFLLMDRVRPRACFTDADQRLVATLVRGMPWFWKELMYSYGLHLDCADLSPTERRILLALLTDQTEREIAERLGQSPKTTHKYVTDLYRKFSVRGRSGLMAHWLTRD